jgi:hypothetical protein
LHFHALEKARSLLFTSLLAGALKGGSYWVAVLRCERIDSTGKGEAKKNEAHYREWVAPKNK